MIEHLARWQALALLRECRRVLAPGGVLRIATPDLADVVAHYETESDGDALMARLGHLVDAPGPRAGSLLRRVFTGSAHQWLYDERSLTRLLEEAGFVDVERRGYRESAIEDVSLLEDRPESLIVEGRRP
jgi:predicted SAM-dependent methyltransferase